MNMKTIGIVLSAAVTILIVSAFFVTDTSNNQEPMPPSNILASSVEIDITGMTCSGCAYYAQSTIEEQEGVVSAEVDAETGKAKIFFDNEKISPQQIVKGVNENTPYEAKVSFEDNDSE